jgi:predicted branched-subunit amino acid permease
MPGLRFPAPAQPAEEQVSFDLKGALVGAKRVLPFALSDLAFGLVFDVLARQAGLSVLEVFLMSTLVFV